MKKGATVHDTNPQDLPDWIMKALDSASCGITVADARQADTPLIYVNRAFEVMTGYSRDEILERNCRFLRGEDHDQSDLDILRQAMDEGRETTVVLRNYRKDGTFFWNELRLAPVFDDQGRLTHYIGIQTDVTAQKEAQAEVQRQARQFHKFLEAIPSGIVVLDAQSRIFFANRAASAITGKTLEPGSVIENLVDYFQVTLAGTDRPYPLEALPTTRALAGETVAVSDIEIRRDGRHIPLHVSASPIHNQQGDISHAVAVFADISEIREKENRLKDEEARHRALLDSSLDAIITINASGIIQSINPATEHIFGYRPEELLGHNVRLLMPEPHRSLHDRYLENYLKTGRAKMIGEAREISALRKDGTVFPIDLTVTEVKLPQGSLFKGIVRDISKRKEAEALAARTLAKLKKSQENLLTLLNQFRVGTVMLDADHRVEFVSESCGQFAGIDRGTAVGRPWDQVLPFGMPSKIQLQRLLDLPPAERYRITLHWQCADRKACWVECDVRDDPQAPDRHILLLYDVTEIHQLRQTIDESRYGRMLGNSDSMRELYQLIEDVARGDWTVLIEGETGVGKELVAHSIHAASPRKDGPFIAVNSAGLSESLLASQLFGHRKGAFTGAVADQEGFFEAAHGGTLFLDEIGDLPLSMQASLLRVLQEKEITRLGETRIRKVDVRILAATHKNLAEEARAGRFREDLLYRLRVARLYVPALRERKADIPLLVESFLCQSYHFSSRAQPRFGAEALQCLMNYDWPGNVRELKACVDYAVIHSKGECINPQDLPPEFSRTTASAVAEPEPMIVGEDERGRILAALEKTRGNRMQAAKMLGISRATFYRRLTELDISPDR
ncbi:PAS domain S-box protein [Methylobacter marinus]|uniref:PAS domain S-box protein n=1 Tax=Methylobacter marinus TaxID=34058 RepID=UPI00036DE308|nr:PAS domain S-box protein [Methylobacter marinus]